MTASEVTQMLALPCSTVYELARRGELPCARLGRTIRFLRDEAEARLRATLRHVAPLALGHMASVSPKASSITSRLDSGAAGRIHHA
jgi:excisionase family DNA binding protein